MKNLLLLSLLATTAFANTYDGAVEIRRSNASSIKLFDNLDAANNYNSNLAFSPLSSYIAMRMAQYGAGMFTKTYDEILGVFTGVVAFENIKRDELLVVNAAFWHEATTLKPDYIAVLKDRFHASAQTLDFSQPEPVRATINAWVAEQTRDKIRDLLPPNSLTRDSRLVLVNALYFNDDWRMPFEPNNTRGRAFNSASGVPREIPFMHQTARFNYAETGNVQILQLPYKNGCVMSLYLPRGNDLAPAFALLGKDLAPDFKPARVNVALPKFKIEWQGSLKSALQELGIREAFTPDADFSRITADEKLFITDVIQAVFIEVDERGTEAAAATGMVFGVTSIDLNPPIEFTADRPFLFTLSSPDKTLLFTGVVREL